MDFKDNVEVENPCVQMTKYTVDVRVKNKNDSLLASAINGQSLKLATIVDGTAPQIFADFSVNGVLDEKYYLPVPYAYDFASQEYTEIEVQVFDNLNNTVLEKTEYAEDLYFLPTKLEEYRIVYFSTDKNGYTQKQEYLLDVDEQTEYTLEQEYSDIANANLGVGSQIALGEVAYLSKNSPKERVLLDCKVMKNGQDVTALGYDKTNGTYTFKEEGAYQAIYYSKDKNIQAQKTVEYNVDTQFAPVYGVKVPQRQTLGENSYFENLEIQVGGKEYSITPVLIYPNDEAYKGNSQIFTMIGKHVLLYQTEIESVTYSYKYIFEVVEPLADIRGLGSYVYDIAVNIDDTQKGLCLSLGDGDVFTLNQIIDLSNCTYNDNLFKIFINPEISGRLELSRINVVLTDIYDASNTVLFQIEQTEAHNRASYVRAAAVGIGQQLSAYHDAYGVSDYQVNNAYGKHTYVNFWGLKHPSGGHRPFTIHFDYADKSVGVESATTGGTKFLDLDASSDFSTPWNGFTTGECYMSIYGEGFSGSTANLILSEAFGVDLSSPYNIDTSAPIMTFDKTFENDILPLGIVDVEYPLFSATAYDTKNGEIEVQKKVFRSYYDEKNKTELDCYGDVFTPFLEGKYYVEYSATDFSGNCSVKVFEVDVLKQALDITCEFENKIVEGSVGAKMQIADIICAGGNGDYAVEIFALSPTDERIEILNNCFVPKEIGNWRICYVITDYVGAELQVSYEVTVKENNLPIIMEDILLPVAFKQGTTYVLPQTLALDYGNVDQIKEVSPKISVEMNGERFVYENSFIPAVQNHQDTVTITYEYVGAKATLIKEFEVPVHIVKSDIGYEMENYFFAQGFNVVAREDCIAFTSESENSYAEFISSLCAKKFSFTFAVDSATNTADKIDVYLTDSKNKNQVLKFSFIKREEQYANCFMSINDGTPFEVVGSFFGNSIYDFGLEFLNDGAVYSDGWTKDITVTKTLIGEAFTGFDSGMVNVRFEINNAPGTQMQVKFLNGQKMSSANNDRVEPYTFLETVDKICFDKPTKVKIPKLYAFDVLDDVNVTLSVYDANNKVMTSVDGILLQNVPVGDYEILLNEIGNYTYRYTVSDVAGNEIPVSKTFYFLDTQAPTLSVNTSTIKGRVGKAIALPTCTAKDNYDAKVDVFVYVKDENGKSENIQSNKYTPKKSGNYTIYYVAYDSYGNGSIVTVSLSVK